MSTKLQPLEPILKVSDSVTRILGQNPGRFTLQGTNTYLIGQRSPYVLLDTGEGKAGYLASLAAALGPDGRISRIVLSHEHRDHWGGLQSTLALLRERQGERPTVHKWTNVAYDGAIVDAMPAGSFKPSADGEALHPLTDGQVISATGCSLTVVHTPGHTDDSISLVLDDGAIFTADTVLGQSTAVFSNLATYLASLRVLAALKPPTLYPGHGPVVEDGTAAIERYIAHRHEREDQILSVLARDVPVGAQMPGDWAAAAAVGAARGGWSTEAIVQVIYPDVGFLLQNAAGQGVDLHLQKLAEEGKVVRVPSSEVEWRLRSDAE